MFHSISFVFAGTSESLVYRSWSEQSPGHCLQSRYKSCPFFWV